MKLLDYIRQHKIGKAAFAQSVGVTVTALNRYVSGERRPAWDVLRRIADVTGGQVMPNDFLPENGGEAGGAQGAADEGARGEASAR